MPGYIKVSTEPRTLQSGALTCGTTAGATRVTCSQDVFARTYARTLNTTATSYVYRGISEDVARSTTSSVATTYAYTAGGSPLGQKIGTAAASYYLRDPHGDTVGLVSVAAQNQGTTSFDPWGKVLGTSGTQPVFGYQSDLTDTLTKQVDMGTRWYAPQTGRFSSRDVVFGDPLHPVSLNQWAYGGANPITMWDPTGMSATPGTIREAPSAIAPPSTMGALAEVACDAVCEFDALVERPDVFAPLYGYDTPSEILARMGELYDTEIRPWIDRMQCSNPDCYGPTTNEQDALYAKYAEMLVDAQHALAPPSRSCLYAEVVLGIGLCWGGGRGPSMYLSGGLSISLGVRTTVGAGGSAADGPHLTSEGPGLCVLVCTGVQQSDTIERCGFKAGETTVGVTGYQFTGFSLSLAGVSTDDVWGVLSNSFASCPGGGWPGG